MTEKIQEVRISFNYIQEDYKRAFLSNYYTNRRNIFALCLLPIILGTAVVYIIFNDSRQGLVYEEYMTLILACGITLIVILRPFSFIKILQQRWNTSYQYAQSEIQR